MNLSAAHVGTQLHSIALDVQDEVAFYKSTPITTITIIILIIIIISMNAQCGLPEKPPERREVDMKTRTREPVLPCNPEKTWKIVKCSRNRQIQMFKNGPMKMFNCSKVIFFCKIVNFHIDIVNLQQFCV